MSVYEGRRVRMNLVPYNTQEFLAHIWAGHWVTIKCALREEAKSNAYHQHENLVNDKLPRGN